MITVPNLSFYVRCPQNTLFHAQENKPHLHTFELSYTNTVSIIRRKLFHYQSDSFRKLQLL